MFKKIFMAVCLIWITVPAVAGAGLMPDVLVEQTVNELIDTLQSQRPELEKDKRKLYQMVEDVVIPHFEVNIIARLVLAKNWRQASPSQQHSFAEEFKKMLIRTYATALFEYTGKEKMDVKPLRIKNGERKAKVETKVTLPGAPPVPVNYSFLLTKEGEWKIYDIVIDGISLVTNYRASYKQFVSQKGLDALISELAAKNQALENA